MNWKLTLALVVIALAMGGAVFWQNAQRGQVTPTPFTLPNAIFTEVRTGQVSRLDVRQGEQVGAVERGEGDAWQLVSPTPGPADTARVESLISSFVNVRATRVLTDAAATGADLSQFGLVQPEITVEAQAREVAGGPFRLSVGREAPISGNRYTRREGTPHVYLVSSSVVSDWLKLITDPPRATPTPTPAPTATPTPGA